MQYTTKNYTIYLICFLTLRNTQTYRKGPSDFSEWTDMETVAVISGTGAGVEDGFPEGAKED